MRDRLSPPETLAVAASQRNDTFESAKRARPVANFDYLAEDDVIYLPPIEAMLPKDRTLSSRDGLDVQVDSLPPGVKQAGLGVGSQQAQSDVIVRRAREDEHRIAEAVTGPGIVHFPTNSEGGS